MKSSHNSAKGNIYKTVYFIRHGESFENVLDVYEGFHSKLTSCGRKQAEQVARRLCEVDFDVLLVSDMSRARKTGTIIAAQTGKPMEVLQELREFSPPASLVGKHTKDKTFLSFLKNRDKHARAGDETWRFDDEETFAEVKKRAAAVLELLLSRKEEKIVVVAHGTFMRIILGVILEVGAFSSSLFHQFRDVLSVSNTGITVFQYTSYPYRAALGKRKGWRLKHWNDCTHFD